MNETLKSQLESLLFVSNKPLSLKQLAKFTDVEESVAKETLEALATERAIEAAQPACSSTSLATSSSLPAVKSL